MVHPHPIALALAGTGCPSLWDLDYLAVAQKAGGTAVAPTGGSAGAGLRVLGAG